MIRIKKETANVGEHTNGNNATIANFVALWKRRFCILYWNDDIFPFIPFAQPPELLAGNVWNKHLRIVISSSDFIIPISNSYFKWLSSAEQREQKQRKLHFKPHNTM